MFSTALEFAYRLALLKSVKASVTKSHHVTLRFVLIIRTNGNRIFCHPGFPDWYQYWRDRRMKWYTDLRLSNERLILREHDEDELDHYSTGTADIEYQFPFLPEGEYGELEDRSSR